MPESCIYHDTLATHELAMAEQGRTYSSADEVDREPVCESCADDHPPEYVRPITYYRCHICGRDIERTYPEHPLCGRCEGAAREAARQMAEAGRQEQAARS